MNSTTKSISCICGSEVEITARDRAFANVHRECSKHGVRPVDREGVDAITGYVRPISGTAPAAVVVSRKKESE